MNSPESIEFTTWRRDLEAQEAFKANPSPWKRRYIPPVEPARIIEIDPRERD